MKRFWIALSVVGMLAGAGTASAQRPGGFGGGFGGGGGVAGLLRMDEVKKELALTDEQSTKLREAIGGGPGGGGGGGQNLSREEMQKRFEEAAKKADEAVKTVLNAKQQERLSELRIQREGIAALARAEVAEKVGLDQAQKDKIKKIQEEALAGARPAGGQNPRDLSDEDRRKLGEEMRQRREKTTSEIIAVLSPQQKEAFEKLQGAKFTFPMPQGRQRNNNN